MSKVSQRVKDIGLKGWYQMKVNFKIIETQVVNDVRMAKCVDEDSKEFYLEITEELLPHLTSSSSYYHIAHAEVEDIIRLLQNSKSIFEVAYGPSELERKSIVGMFEEGDNIFGKSTIYSLRDRDYVTIDNKDVLSLIINHIKYYKNEQQEEDSL
jgi:hypothetical protein